MATIKQGDKAAKRALGRRLKAVRQTIPRFYRGMAMAAREAGVTAGAISYWESGRKSPSAINLAKLAKVYGVSTDELLGLVKG